MGKQFRWDRIAAGGALRDDLAQLGGIPEDDAGGEQVHAGDAIMLPFAGAVPDLAATVEADGALQGVVGLTLVESDLGLALHAGVEDPVDHEQASLDATDLAHGDGEFMLAAGWGLIVAQGSVVIDGIEVAQDRYFKPRLTDLNGTGAGIILLVR